MRIIQELLEYRVYDTLAYLRADLPQSLPWPIWVSFSNNVDVEVGIDPLFDNFGSDSVVLLLFPSLGSYSKISTRPVYYIPDLLLFEHDLSKIGLLRPIFKVIELFSLALAIVVFVRHLEGGEKCSAGVAERIPDLLT